MEDDQPVPDQIKGQKKIEQMRGVKDTGLEGGNKRYPRIIMGVP